MSDAAKERPKTMLIIKSNASALTTVETFLRNRGWKIYSTPNLKEALAQLVEGKPSYVLISVDHPNKKVQALPKLLHQAFPVATIAFAENQNAFSYKMLNESASEYRVYPPVTGPAIERCVNKYLKDQQTRESLQNANTEFKSGTTQDKKNDNLISIKGGAPSSFESHGGEDAASRLLHQFLSKDSAHFSPGSPPAAATKNDSGLIFARPVDEEEDSSSGVAYMPRSSTNDDLGSLTARENQNGFGQTYTQNESLDPLDGSNPENSEKKGPDRAAREATPLWSPTDLNEDRTRFLKERLERSEANQTLIAKGTQQALYNSVVNHDGVVREKIEVASNMACITVESSRFAGYLVAVMGNNKNMEVDFISTIKQRLFKFLKDNGEPVSEEDALGIKIKQVAFEPWALEYADFLRKSVHQGNEVAMAFFPRRPPKVILEESRHQDMAKLHISDLVGDRPVEFDLYMYLPNNNKYVLYTPKGGVFYNKQLERLKNQGVTHMHVQKDAVKSISKYKAQNYLNDLVDDYDQKLTSASNTKQKAS